MATFQDIMADNIKTLDRADELLVRRAYLDYLNAMIAEEGKVIKDIERLAKSLTTTTDEGLIASTEANLARSRAALKSIQNTLDASISVVPVEWSELYLPKAYTLGRTLTNMELETAQLLGNNVDQLFAALDAITVDPLTAFPVKTSAFRTASAYSGNVEQTTKWLQKELFSAVNRGIPVGNLTDIGKERETLIGNLMKSDTRLRGYIKNGRHISAEQHALAIARNETTAVSNRVAESQARALGLRAVYNANPTDANTTDVCQRATSAGVMNINTMIARHGRPPRIQKEYHLCRSWLVFAERSWLRQSTRRKAA